MVTCAVRVLTVLLLALSCIPPTGRVDAASTLATHWTGGNQMASDDEKSAADKKPPNPPDSPDMVNTPAGPVPKEQVHEVKPGETVRQNKDGTVTKVPRSN